MASPSATISGSSLFTSASHERPNEQAPFRPYSLRVLLVCAASIFVGSNAGISINIEDLKTPKIKKDFIKKYGVLDKKIYLYFFRY